MTFKTNQDHILPSGITGIPEPINYNLQYFIITTKAGYNHRYNMNKFGSIKIVLSVCIAVRDKGLSPTGAQSQLAIVGDVTYVSSSVVLRFLRWYYCVVVILWYCCGVDYFVSCFG